MKSPSNSKELGGVQELLYGYTLQSDTMQVLTNSHQQEYCDMFFQKRIVGIPLYQNSFGSWNCHDRYVLASM